MADQIPEECMNDPQFRQVLEAALNSEIKTAEKTLAELEAEIEQSKKSFFRDYEFRQQSKQQINDLKTQNAVLEQALDRLMYQESEQSGEITLLKERLDDATLKAQALQKRQFETLKQVKETWAKYEADYEKFPLAMKRREVKSGLEKLKVQLMMKQFKKAEHLKMLKQREKIYEIQTRSAVVDFSKMVLKRWEAQKYTSELLVTIKSLECQLKAVTQQYEKNQKQLEEEAKARAASRHQMPPPKLNRSLMQSLYVARSPKISESPREQIRTMKRSMDFDTISIDSRMFDEINDQENCYPSDVSTDNQQEENSEDSHSTKAVQLASADEAEQQNKDTPLPEEPMQTLERVCSQLNIEEEMCNETNHDISPEMIEDKDLVTRMKSEQESQLLQSHHSSPVINPLKKLSSFHKSPMKELEQPEKKRAKLNRQSSNASLLSNSSRLTTESINKIMRGNSTTSQSKEMPRIKSIENVTRPINIITDKPQTLQVPETPSELFSPRYAPSFASYDSNNEEQASFIQGMTDYSSMGLPANWQHMTSPAPSVSSIASSYVTKKTAINKNPTNVVSQPGNTATDSFLNFFTAGPSNKNSLF